LPRIFAASPVLRYAESKDMSCCGGVAVVAIGFLSGPGSVLVHVFIGLNGVRDEA
jgi:hypothetical protein